MTTETKGSHKQHYAVIAGLCASSASFFGKLTGTDAYDFVEENFIRENIWIIRIICFILMILCNAFVWTFFVKALHSKGGTLIATVMSAATNYSVSFFVGALIFGENVSLNSIIGITLILFGLFFLTREEKEKNQ